MHHKRKRPRNRRAGCKLCKPWKVNGVRTKADGGEKFSDHRRRRNADADLKKSVLIVRPHELRWRTGNRDE
jgi:hypothetical protein